VEKWGGKEKQWIGGENKLFRMGGEYLQENEKWGRKSVDLRWIGEKKIQTGGRLHKEKTSDAAAIEDGGNRKTSSKNTGRTNLSGNIRRWQGGGKGGWNEQKYINRGYVGLVSTSDSSGKKGQGGAWRDRGGRPLSERNEEKMKVGEKRKTSLLKQKVTT